MQIEVCKFESQDLILICVKKVATCLSGHLTQETVGAILGKPILINWSVLKLDFLGALKRIPTKLLSDSRAFRNCEAAKPRNRNIIVLSQLKQWLYIGISMKKDRFGLHIQDPSWSHN